LPRRSAGRSAAHPGDLHQRP